MERRARSEQQARQPWASGKWNSKAAALACGRKKTEISCALLPLASHPAFAATEGGTGACASTGPTPKGHLLTTLSSSRNRHSHSPGQFQPHPPPFFLLERQQITLSNCGDTDWKKKYLTADIFKLRCLHVHQVWVCEIFHHHSQVFLISYLWILDSQIPFLSWRLFI